jgi:hypothetical protein
MDRYKAAGTKTEKWHGTGQEKSVAQGGKRHLSKKGSMLVHSGELVLLYFSIGDKT